jgi:ribosomal protein S18 acetylase RimI-like enzyme
MMHTRAIKPKYGPRLTVRPLRNRDVDTVLALFARLGDESRRLRFNGPKPRLRDVDLQELARVDTDHHALVAYVDGDPEPVAIARLVRDGVKAEIAFAVADGYQQRGIGSALTRELITDARVAGVTEVTALVSNDNPAAIALLRRTLHALEIRLDGPEYWIRATIGPSFP